MTEVVVVEETTKHKLTRVPSRWDASSGAARVDFFDGATSTYRVILPDGHVQGVEVCTPGTIYLCLHRVTVRSVSGVGEEM